MEGEEETSIFGDGILMVSQGSRPLWAPPPQMAVQEKPAGEEQQKMSVIQMSKHWDSDSGALQLRKSKTTLSLDLKMLTAGLGNVLRNLNDN